MMLCPEAKLDLPAAGALHAALRAADPATVCVDMSQVTHLGALCVQVLMVAARSRIAAGGGLSMINTTDRVLDQLRLMGLTPETIAKGGL